MEVVPCGAACSGYDWCRLWCHEAPRGCLLTSLIASASYTPSKSKRALSCYTSRLPDLAVGAAITSSPPYNPNGKLKENLVDGIYDYTPRGTAKIVGDNGTHAWFLLDLGAAVPVSEVLLVAPPTTNTERFSNIEVRVGDVQTAGNFPTYQLLGTSTGPVQPLQTVVLRPVAPITGRYVSIQRTTDGILQIAHLEIR